ncbi:MAG: GumC family protein [Pseudomonadota bacterium]
MPEPNASPIPGLDLDFVRAALRERRATFLTFFATVVLATLAVTLLQTRKYEAVALLQLMPRAGLEIAVEEVVRNDVAGYLEGQERARTQIQIIQSRSVSEKVLTTYADLGYTDLSPGPDGIAALAGALSVRPRENTQLVEIRVEHEDPERAAVLANLIAESYSSFNLGARTDAARESKDWIDARIQSARAEYDAASEAARSFRQDHDLVDVDEDVNGVTSRLASLQAALGDATTARVLLQSRLDNLLSLYRKQDYGVLAGMFPSDPTLETMSRERATIVVESAEVLARYGEQHPEHQRAVGRMQRVDSLLEEAVRRNIEGVRSQVALLERQEQQIDDELRKVKVELLDRQRLQVEYAEMERDEARARELYDALKSRVTEVDLQARSQLNDVRIVDHAIAPQRPSSPNLPLNLAVALLVGLCGGFGLAILSYRLDRGRIAAAAVPASPNQPAG